MTSSGTLQLIIRKATSEDFNEVSKLLQSIAIQHHEGRPDLFKPGTKKYTQEDFDSKLSDHNFPVFVAEDKENKIVLGYAFCEIIEHKEKPISYGRKYLYIDDFCVNEQARGKNIGSALMEYIKTYALGKSLYSIELNVWEFNSRAIAFYEKNGMHTQRRQMEFIL